MQENGIKQDQDLIFDVTLFGITYRVTGVSRSNAVTNALEKYMEANSETTWPLSILRLRCRTRQVDLESELLDKKF